MTIPRYVYLIKIPGYAYKIGMTKNKMQRFSDLRMDYGSIIKLYSFFTPHPYLWEQFLHWKFEHCWIEGELFNLGIQDVIGISKYPRFIAVKPDIYQMWGIHRELSPFERSSMDILGNIYKFEDD